MGGLREVPTLCDARTARAQVVQVKEQGKSPKADPKEMESNDLSDRHAPATVTKMPAMEITRTVHEQSENFTRDRRCF